MLRMNSVLWYVVCALYMTNVYGESTHKAMNIELVTLDVENELVQRIAYRLSTPIIAPRINRFADGEIKVFFDDPSRFAGKTVLLIQSTNTPVLERILTVAFTIQELKHAGALRVIGLFPYFGYSRQERSRIPGKSGHAALVARLLEAAGLDALITVELHTPIIETFFSIPVRNVVLADYVAHHIKQQGYPLDEVCLVAPDKGAADHVAAIAKRLGVGMLVFSKERYDVDQTRVTGKSGDCRGTTAIIIDDIIDTGGTALHVCKELSVLGYTKIIGYFVHPVLSGDAVERIERSVFSKVFISDTIEQKNIEGNKIVVFDISEVLVDAIKQFVQ